MLCTFQVYFLSIPFYLGQYPPLVLGRRMDLGTVIGEGLGLFMSCTCINCRPVRPAALVVPGRSPLGSPLRWTWIGDEMFGGKREAELLLPALTPLCREELGLGLRLRSLSVQSLSRNPIFLGFASPVSESETSLSMEGEPARDGLRYLEASPMNLVKVRRLLPLPSTPPSSVLTPPAFS